MVGSAPRHDIDPVRLRQQAKDLRARALGGDRVARERIRRAHPRFRKARPTDVELSQFTNSDALLCIARELGFSDWRNVLAQVRTDRVMDRPWQRWPEGSDTTISDRCRDVSVLTGCVHVGVEHAVGAILLAKVPTIASEALREAGLTWDHWFVLHKRNYEKQGEASPVTFTPAWYRLIGFAEALALTDGGALIKDEHLLLALAYRRNSSVPDPLTSLGVDPDEIVRHLARHGVTVPAVLPAVTAATMKPVGPRIYLPANEFSAVTRRLKEMFPPGTGLWGWNSDSAGRYWIQGEDELDLGRVVRSIVEEPERIVLEFTD